MAQIKNAMDKVNKKRTRAGIDFVIQVADQPTSRKLKRKKAAEARRKNKKQIK